MLIQLSYVHKPKTGAIILKGQVTRLNFLLCLAIPINFLSSQGYTIIPSLTLFAVGY